MCIYVWIVTRVRYLSLKCNMPIRKLCCCIPPPPPPTFRVCMALQRWHGQTAPKHVASIRFICILCAWIQLYLMIGWTRANQTKRPSSPVSVPCRKQFFFSFIHITSFRFVCLWFVGSLLSLLLLLLHILHDAQTTISSLRFDSNGNLNRTGLQALSNIERIWKNEHTHEIQIAKEWKRKSLTLFREFVWDRPISSQCTCQVHFELIKMQQEQQQQLANEHDETKSSYMQIVFDDDDYGWACICLNANCYINLSPRKCRKMAKYGWSESEEERKQKDRIKT